MLGGRKERWEGRENDIPGTKDILYVIIHLFLHWVEAVIYF